MHGSLTHLFYVSSSQSEKLILEHQEKASRLQRRLNQAEQRAASASQQVGVPHCP